MKEGACRDGGRRFIIEIWGEGGGVEGRVIVGEGGEWTSHDRLSNL